MKTALLIILLLINIVAFLSTAALAYLAIGMSGGQGNGIIGFLILGGYVLVPLFLLFSSWKVLQSLIRPGVPNRWPWIAAACLAILLVAASVNSWIG